MSKMDLDYFVELKRRAGKNFLLHVLKQLPVRELIDLALQQKSQVDKSVFEELRSDDIWLPRLEKLIEKTFFARKLMPILLKDYDSTKPGRFYTASILWFIFTPFQLFLIFWSYWAHVWQTPDGNSFDILDFCCWETNISDITNLKNIDLHAASATSIYFYAHKETNYIKTRYKYNKTTWIDIKVLYKYSTTDIHVIVDRHIKNYYGVPDKYVSRLSELLFLPPEQRLKLPLEFTQIPSFFIRREEAGSAHFIPSTFNSKTKLPTKVPLVIKYGIYFASLSENNFLFKNHEIDRVVHDISIVGRLVQNDLHRSRKIPDNLKETATFKGDYLTPGIALFDIQTEECFIVRPEILSPILYKWRFYNTMFEYKHTNTEPDIVAAKICGNCSSIGVAFYMEGFPNTYYCGEDCATKHWSQ